MKKIVFAVLLLAALPLSFTVGKEPLIHSNVEIDDVQANPKDFRHLKKIKKSKPSKIKTVSLKSIVIADCARIPCKNLSH